MATGENNTIIRIDAHTNQVLATIDLGGSVAHVAVGAGAVWAVLPEDTAIVCVDLSTNQVTACIPVDGFLAPSRSASENERKRANGFRLRQEV